MQEPRFCATCRRPLAPGIEYCPGCGAYQAPPQTERPLTYEQYSGPFQPPTGRGSTAFEAYAEQQALYMQPVMVPVLVQPRTSGFAVASLVLGIVGLLLALFDLVLDLGSATETYKDSTQTLTNLIFAIFAWTPALLAFIFGLISRRRARLDGEQTPGLAYAGIILGAVGLGVPLLGVLLYFLSLIA